MISDRKRELKKSSDQNGSPRSLTEVWRGSIGKSFHQLDSPLSGKLWPLKMSMKMLAGEDDRNNLG